MLPAGQRIEYKYVILEEQVSSSTVVKLTNMLALHALCGLPSRVTCHNHAAFVSQDWIKLENEDAEGLVEVTYRTGSEPGKPPDVQVIQKQMAIVAWQPGPNRIVQVPTEVSRPLLLQMLC